MDSDNHKKIKVFVKGGRGDRVLHWDHDSLDNNLRSKVINDNLYVIASIHHGGEEYLGVHRDIWAIYDELRDFSSHETPTKKMLTFCDNNLKTCEQLLAKHTEIEKRFFSQKVGADFDYDTDISNIEKYINIAEDRSAVLQLVINILGKEEKVSYDQSIVIKLFLIECAYMVQMGTALLVLLEILTRLRDTANAKKKLGIFEYRKMMKQRKEAINQLNEIGGQLNISRDLFYMTFAELI